MKRFFKTLLVALVLVPALCLVTACGGGNNGGSTGGGNGGGGNGGGGTVVEETLQQKYEVLIAAIGNMAQKSSYTVVAQSEQIDASTGNLQVKDNGEWVDADEEEQPEAENWSSKSKNVATLNTTTGEYAENSYVWVDEEPAEEIGIKGVADEEDAGEFEPYWQITKGEYIVKDTSGEEPVWIHYFTTEEEGPSRLVEIGEPSVTLCAEYVSPDHAAHVFGFADANEEMTSMVNGSTLDEAVESLDQMLQLYLGFMSMGFELDLTDYDITTNPTTTITKEGDVYSLNITFTLAVTPKAEEEAGEEEEPTRTAAEETTVELSATATFAITYTATEIRSYLSDMRFTTTTTTETENSKATFESTMGMVASAEITYEYDSNIMAEGIGAYTEAELEPEQALVYAALYVDGKESVGDYLPWGENVAEDIGFEYAEEEFNIENAHVDGWYYDAACTQKVGEEDEIIFKSWETPVLYARSEADEGYVLVIEKDGYILDPAQIEIAKQRGKTVEDDGFYVGGMFIFTVEVTDSLDLSDWDIANVDYSEYEIEKITVDGVEYTEPITEHEEGHVYQVRVYADMDVQQEEGGGAIK